MKFIFSESNSLELPVLENQESLLIL